MRTHLAEGGLSHAWLRAGAGTKWAPQPCRLNQQQLSELRAQVEDLQKALQEQGGKTEDVSAHLLPAWPSFVSPNNPSLSSPCCPMPCEVHCKYLEPRVAPPTLSLERGWDLWSPHSPSASSLLQSTLLKRKLEEHL